MSVRAVDAARQALTRRQGRRLHVPAYGQGRRVGALTAALVVLGAAVEVHAQVPTSSPGEVLSWGEFQTIERAAPDTVVQWGELPEHFAEVFVPAGTGPHPVVMLVHGGCWLSIADTGYVSHLARAFAAGGWAVWVPEFRRVDMAGGAFPGILDDVRAGLDALPRFAESLALDLDRVVTVGHSSGGHLALWLAGHAAHSGSGAAVGAGAAPAAAPAAVPAPVQVRGVIGMAAIAGLEDYHAGGGGGCGPNAVSALLDAAPGSREWQQRLALAEPGVHLAALGTPVLLVAGALDPIVSVEHQRGFIDALQDPAPSGSRASLEVVEGAGHFELVAPWTEPFERFWPSVTAFLGRVSATAPSQSPATEFP